MSEREVRTGRCHCGGVAFEVCASATDVTFCHCRDCRRTTGHIHASVGIKEKNLSLVKDETLRWYNSTEDIERGFCSVCGGNLFWRSRTKDDLAILAGMFDEPSGLTSKQHIFVASKGDYYDLDDDLPKADQW